MTVIPEVPTVVVPEDNGTVTVCYNTSTGISEPLTINVTTVQYTMGNIATGKDSFLVCSCVELGGCVIISSSTMTSQQSKFINVHRLS